MKCAERCTGKPQQPPTKTQDPFQRRGFHPSNQPSTKREKENLLITHRMFRSAPWAKSRAPDAKSAPPETSKNPKINSMRVKNRATDAKSAPLPSEARFRGAAANESEAAGGARAAGGAGAPFAMATQ